MKTPDQYVGKWPVTHIDEWDQEFVDLIVPGHITLRKDGTGSFQFGAVQGEMDCGLESIGNQQLLGFSWSGSDEGMVCTMKALPQTVLTGVCPYHLESDALSVTSTDDSAARGLVRFAEEGQYGNIAPGN